MTKDELISFIKENLTIKVQNFDNEIQVTIKLCEETICSDSAYIITNNQ